MYLKQAKQMYYQTQSQNDNIVKFLGELENVVPASIQVLAFKSDYENMVMTLEVDTKEEATSLINEMRNFSSLADISVSTITEDADDDGGNIRVTFTITGAYAPVTMATEDTGGTPEGETESSETTEQEVSE